MGSLSLLVCDWRGLVSSLCGASKPAHKGKEREVSLLWVWWRAEELEAHNQPNQFTHSAASFDLFDYLLSISLPFQQSNQTNFTFRLFDGAERKTTLPLWLPRFIVQSQITHSLLSFSICSSSIRLGLGASLLFGLVACGLQPPLTHPKTILLPSCSTHNFIHS